jgi:hypothetical protein
VTQLLPVLQHQTLVHALFGIPFLSGLLGFERRDQQRVRRSFTYHILIILDEMK